jgi:hypothetical protein
MHIVIFVLMHFEMGHLLTRTQPNQAAQANLDNNEQSVTLYRPLVRSRGWRIR